MVDLFDGLNEAQKEAVRVGQGPMLVLAGPGSGKTRVIVHRIAHLMEHFGVPDHRILAVTFTNKAADELKERLRALVGDRRPLACTFHSLCARILRQFAAEVGRTPKFTILDQRDRGKMLATLIKDAGEETGHFTPDAVERLIGKLKNDLISPVEFEPQASGIFEKTVATIYAAYMDRLAATNSVDFDDLLFLVADLLRREPSIRAELDRRFEYVLVDEYQDTNIAQYAIARALSLDAQNLCVTGDPDQSIYSWRGANVRNILDFESDFPGAKVIRLERNYRSVGNILGVADGLIRYNRHRKNKDLWTENPPGEPVVVRCYRDDREEAAGVAGQIRRAVDNADCNYRDIAVFVRTSGLTRGLETAFRDRRIPYRVIGGFSFFERKEVKDAVAYLRLAINPRDDAAFERVANVPPRGIGETSLNRLRDYAVAHRISMVEAARDVDKIVAIRGKAKAGLRDIAQVISQMEAALALPLTEAVQRIVELSGSLKQFDEDDPEDRDRIDNIKGLVASAFDLEQVDPEANAIRFLETVSLSTDLDLYDQAADVVSIMTLHAAKGLEFPTVYMVAFEDKVLPHERSLRDNDIEEERRLAFVGITRARNRLELSYALRRNLFGFQNFATPSRFLAEIPDDFLDRQDRTALRANLAPSRSVFDDDNQESDYDEPAIQILTAASQPSTTDRFRKGMFVDHPVYGRGQILQLEGIAEGRKATIEFPSVGAKRFVLSKSPIEPA